MARIWMIFWWNRSSRHTLSFQKTKNSFSTRLWPSRPKSIGMNHQTEANVATSSDSCPFFSFSQTSSPLYFCSIYQNSANTSIMWSGRSFLGDGGCPVQKKKFFVRQSVRGSTPHSPHSTFLYPFLFWRTRWYASSYGRISFRNVKSIVSTSQ